MDNVRAKLLPKLLENPDWKTLRTELQVEIHNDYSLSLRKAIIDYVLKDQGELQRLKIGSIPKSHPQRSIRAPVPWNDSMRVAKEAQTQQLFISNTVMTQLQNLWHNKSVNNT